MAKKTAESGVPNIQVTVQVPPSAPDPSQNYKWWFEKVVVPITVASVAALGVYFASRRSLDTSETARMPSGLYIVNLQVKYTTLPKDLKTKASDASRLARGGEFEKALEAFMAIRDSAADSQVQLDADINKCVLAYDAKSSKYNACRTQYWQWLVEENPDHVVANVDLALIYQSFNCEVGNRTVQQCRDFVERAFKVAREHGINP